MRPSRGRPFRETGAAQAHPDHGTLSDTVTGGRKSAFGSVQAVCTVLGFGLRDVIVFVEANVDRVAA